MTTSRWIDPPKHTSYTQDYADGFHAQVVRRFLESDDAYSALCQEISYIVTRATEQHMISTASIGWRRKTLASFLEKMRRKGYAYPFVEITDRAGVRIVCNYRSDCARVAKVIEDLSVLEVVESQDKLHEMAVDKFGYGAHHLLVKLSADVNGPRYSELKQLVCEIQIRSLLQDAWAVLQHELFYKQEDRVPDDLLRDVYALSALLESADNGFEALRKERDRLTANLANPEEDTERFLMSELTLDSFVAYLRWRFPSRPVERSEGQARRILSDLDHQIFRLLSDLDGVISSFSDQIAAVGREVDEYDLAQGEPRPSVYDAVWAAAMRDPRMLTGTGLPLHWREALRHITPQSA